MIRRTVWKLVARDEEAAYFLNPIPDYVVILGCILVDHCIREYLSGVHVRTRFNEGDIRSKSAVRWVSDYHRLIH